MISRDGMGESAYISKYMAKGVGQLAKCLVLLEEAVKTALQHPSVATDINTNQQTMDPRCQNVRHAPDAKVSGPSGKNN